VYPILLDWGPIRIGSYGLLLACAFLSSIFVTNREFRKADTDLALAWDIYLLAIVGGMGGSRLLYIIENLDHFWKHPWEVISSGTGFSVLGGYLLAILLCAWRVKAAGESFLRMADLCAPGMAIGYTVGRLGCITAGDGCYGLPTLVPWGMNFPRGLVSTLSVKNLHLTRLFQERFPGLPVPADIPVHPTPLYESFSALVLCLLLIHSTWELGRGRRIGFFLGWFGISRFFVEFIRINPVVWRGLTSDQLLAIGILSMGAILFFLPRPIPSRPQAEPPAPADGLPYRAKLPDEDASGGPDGPAAG